MNNAKPLLIYDGDCGFCAYWVRYWQKLTQGRVAFRPFQETAAQFPSIPLSEFRAAVQYVAPDGKISRAAEASFLTLSHAPGQAHWLFLYRRLPLFAKIAEAAYALIARHRPAFYRVSRWLWGENPEPPQYRLIAGLFLRGLGLIYLAAFVSFGAQAAGLISSHGLLPLADLIAAAGEQLGRERYWKIPMVFWFNASDVFIQIVCWGGALLSLLLAARILPRTCLILLYALYLSLVHAGQRFTTYQWDLFLLEAGFIGIILGVLPATGVWLLRWLMFRFMMLAGLVKIYSGDPAWHDLTALNYHFETQPLPTPMAWHAHHLPTEALAFMTGATLFIELIAPFMIFLTRRLRLCAAFLFALLQAAIILTGNYNFFNVLTLLVCLALLDDAAVRRFVPEKMEMKMTRPHKAVAYIAGLFALLTVLLGSIQIHLKLGGTPPEAAMRLNDAVAPFNAVNLYGPFAVMTKERPEIIVEGSDDGIEWKEYAFPYKMGDLNRAPPWNIPHQPRLDWQMWFGALEPPMRNQWFVTLLHRLLEGSPEVLALLEHNPFPGKPPARVRAQLYIYRFTTPEEKAETGAWWRRELKGIYFPEVALNGKNG